MRYNYRYGILFKFDPSMDMIINSPYGYMTILSLFYDFTREYKKGDVVNFTYNKSSAKKIIDWFDKEGKKINLMN